MQMNIDLLALAEWLVKTGLNALGPNSLEVASKATGGLHLNTMKDRSSKKPLTKSAGTPRAVHAGLSPVGRRSVRLPRDQKSR